jgi:hypothetical protein
MHQNTRQFGTVLGRIVDGTPYTAMDVFGPTVEFISGPDDPGAGGNLHAHRNVSDEPAVDLVITSRVLPIKMPPSE